MSVLKQEALHAVRTIYILLPPEKAMSTILLVIVSNKIVKISGYPNASK